MILLHNLLPKQKGNWKERTRKKSLRSIAIACYRGVLSDRAAVSVASPVLDYLGMIDQTGITDRNKIRRECATARPEIQTQEKVTQPPIRINFDDRKDISLITEGKGRTQRKRMVNKEHITIFFLQSTLVMSAHPQQLPKISVLKY